MKLPLSKLQYTFTKKPILVGGKAMEYYGLRKSGADIDLIATEPDVVNLIRMYPDKVKDLYADLGVCPFEFEIWRSISLMSYEMLVKNSVEEDNYLVVSIPDLLLMKVLAIKEEKYLQDTKLIAEKISKDLYKGYEAQKEEVKKILNETDNVSYLQKLP